MNISHPFNPIYNFKSKILILGSFPSVKSREVNFYYGHPQNRFWKILSNIFKENIDDNISSKKDFLLEHNIALWDIIQNCDINASSDASIKNPKVNDINELITKSNIQTIFCNGNTSYKIFKKFCTNINIPVVLQMQNILLKN